MKILMKRGVKANLPTLDVGEIALTTDTKEVYIGTASGNLLVNPRDTTAYKTSNSGGTYSGYYSKIATLSITQQYAYANATILMVGGGDGGVTYRKAIVDIRLKQQSALATAPYTELNLIEARGFSTTDFGAVITKNDSTGTTVELYVKFPSYEGFNFKPLITNTNSTITFHESQSFVSTLPSGTVLTVNDLTKASNNFSNIKIGATTIVADSANDTLELVAGTNITLTPDATNDKITISASGGAGGATPVEDNLVSTSTTNALSANQGRVLNSLIANKQDATSITGYTAVTPPSSYPMGLSVFQTGTFTDYPSLYGTIYTGFVNVNRAFQLFVDKANNIKTRTADSAQTNGWTAWRSLATTDLATTTVAGLLSSTDKAKLDGIASGAQANQNAFSNVKVGATIVSADNATDTLELVAGANITLTPDATNDSIIISASSTPVSSLYSSLVVLGDDGNNYELTIDANGAITTTQTSKTPTTSTGFVVQADFDKIGINVMDKRWAVVGDGVADDTEELRKVHDYANLNNLPVYYPPLTFLLKNPTSIIKIKTNTNFGEAKIIIDESYNDTSKPRFRVDSQDDYSGSTYRTLTLSSTDLTSVISKMKRGTTKISEFAPYRNCVFIVEDSTNNTGIRTGDNAGAGNPKAEVFVVEDGGRIVGEISQDFTNITNIQVQTMEESWLTVEGGKFYLTGASHSPALPVDTYVYSGFHIRRCRTIFKNQYIGLKAGNEDVQYEASIGFYNASSISDITFENIRLLPRVYETVSGNPQGTYGMGFSKCMNITMKNVRAEADELHWGLYAPNNIKNLVVENCEINRVDTHFWCWNARISNTAIGMKGVSFTGGGRLIIENSSIMGNQIVDFREDYGAFWDGDIYISNVTLFPFDSTAEIHLLQFDQSDYDYKVNTPIGRSIIMRDITVDYRYITSTFTPKAFILYMPTFGQKTSGYRTQFPNQIIVENVRAVGTYRKGFILGSIHNPFDAEVYNKVNGGIDSNGVITTNCTIRFKDIDTYDFGAVNPTESSRSNMSFIMNVSDTAVYKTNAVIPDILIENCGKIFASFKASLANVVIRNCTINCFDNLESTGKTDITFDNCLFKPNATSNTRVYYVSGKTTYFDNCTFDIGQVNGVNTFSLDYGIISWDSFVRGNTSNCRCTEAFYSAYQTANGKKVTDDFVNFIASGQLRYNSGVDYRTYVISSTSVASFGAVGDGTTSDQTAIVNAVASAYANGYTLDWGNKGLTYLTTDTIPNFHQVKHVGNGIVKRGTDLFYISPKGTQTNTIYVGVSGSSNTFDGLSASKPVAKLQQAFDWIANYAPMLSGSWQINMTAGTFVRATLKDGLMMENPLVINGYNVGAYPAVPTTIISEGAGASAVGVLISGGSKVIMNNIKVTGFNGTTSSAGLKATDGAELTTSNVHTDSCYWGVSGENRAEIIVPDGIHNNNGYLNGGGGNGSAIRSLQLTRHAIGIQNNGNQTNTAQFTNCYQAMFAQESSTGHMDWCTIQNCNTGIVTRVNARVNCDGTKFIKNTTDITVDSNAHVYISSAVVFSTGINESTNKIVTSNGGTITNNTIITGKEYAYSTIDRTIDRQFVNQTVATTSNTTVYTATFKAPLWRSTPTQTALMSKVTVKLTGTMNGANSNKRIYMRFGSAVTSLTYASTDNGTFIAEGQLYFTAPDAQYLFLTSYRHLGSSPKQSRTIGANVMTSDVNLTIEGQVDNTSDNIVFDIIEVVVSG